MRGWDKEAEMKFPQHGSTILSAKWVRNHVTDSLKMTAAIFYMVDKFSMECFIIAVHAYPRNYATFKVLVVLKGLWSEALQRKFSTNTTCNHNVNHAIQEQCVTEL